MTQPLSPVLGVDFSDDEANGVSGRSSVRTAQLDGALTNLKTAIDQIIANLAIIQRDDTMLADGTVIISALSSQVIALMASTAFHIKGAWLTATAYVAGDVVLQAGVLYACMVAHTSNNFGNDLVNGLWGQVTANGTAAATSFTPTSTIAATNVQNAITEVDRELRPPAVVLIRELFNGL